MFHAFCGVMASDARSLCIKRKSQAPGFTSNCESGEVYLIVKFCMTTYTDPLAFADFRNNHNLNWEVAPLDDTVFEIH